ncbi:MAG TPA: pantetheine-phosphate adenylyltransferase, partial [Thermoplasmatales archaeon]|nr:pantetheine-phosphate adenylyltransferase [Thermoplasmatales archaeon]
MKIKTTLSRNKSNITSNVLFTTIHHCYRKLHIYDFSFSETVACMKKNKRVCIGGTFDRLHKGHKALIDKAIETAGENGWVFIGVTKGEIANKKKDVSPFKKRVQDVKNYLKEKGFSSQSEVQPIYDKYGPSVEGDFDVIVVSPETYKVA